MRDEGAHMIEAIEELLTIAREANIRAEIYHLKSSGKANWPVFDAAVMLIEEARAEGLEVTADIYTYPAGIEHRPIGFPGRLVNIWNFLNNAESRPTSHLTSVPRHRART